MTPGPFVVVANGNVWDVNAVNGEHIVSCGGEGGEKRAKRYAGEYNSAWRRAGGEALVEACQAARRALFLLTENNAESGEDIEQGRRALKSVGTALDLVKARNG